MKILHAMLSCTYSDNFNYQENALPRQNASDGHTVMIVASTETLQVNSSTICSTPHGSYLNEDNIDVTRVPYATWLPRFLMRKIRAYKSVHEILNTFTPDVIFCHGTSTLELITFSRYIRSHPQVKFFVDSHADQHNSGTNPFSKFILHHLFYRFCLHTALPHITKIFYISHEAKCFLLRFYKAPEHLLEFFPLGGSIPEESKSIAIRAKTRSDLNLSENDILFVHSGKLDTAKRTNCLIEAFSRVHNDNFKLFIIGSMPDNMKQTLVPMIKKDARISWLGWKQANELVEILSACDMYIQPGSQSATLQNALCTFAPIMVFPHSSHQPYLNKNGFFVKTVEDIEQCFLKISECPAILQKMRIESEIIARELLDYTKLARRIYQ